MKSTVRQAKREGGWQRHIAIAPLLIATFASGCTTGGAEDAARAVGATASATATAESRGAVCPDHDPLRQAFFGDVHIHTSWSMDAYTANVPGTPEDAYRFARGERTALSGGRACR